MKRILIAEDETSLREGIACAFVDRGWEVREAADGGAAMSLLDEEIFDVLVCDYRMPVHDGFEVLERCRAVNESTAVILLTAYGTIESAVEAMRAGASDYLLKPFDLEELELKVERALQNRRLVNRMGKDPSRESPPGTGDLVTESPSMKELLATLCKVAPSSTTVLLLGETGSGKGLVAETIHGLSERREQPFVTVNCATLPETLLESELFGHERGAFTGASRQRIGRFEVANEGTLFLDEIGNLNASTQAKLLRVLQSKEFERVGDSRTIRADVRLIAATNRDLDNAVARGEFRDDLYYRLNVISLRVPSLRERTACIPVLAQRFLDRFAAEMDRNVQGFDEAARRMLVEHPWPGNVRELENAIERAVLLCETERLTPADLGLAEGAAPHETPGEATSSIPGHVVPLAELERCALIQALQTNGWVQKRAARSLGISPRVMNYKIKSHGITHPSWGRQTDGSGRRD